MVIGAELEIIIIVIFGQAQGNDAGPGVVQRKRLGIHGLGVPNELHGRLHIAFIPAALAARHEELARQQFLDQSALVGGARGADAHGLEVGDGDGDEVAVEAEHDAA